QLRPVRPQVAAKPPEGGQRRVPGMRTRANKDTSGGHCTDAKGGPRGWHLVFARPAGGARVMTEDSALGVFGAKPSFPTGWRSDGDSGTLASPAPCVAAGRAGTHGFWGQCMSEWAPGPALAAYHAGVMVIGELAAQFTEQAWAGPTTCVEWRAADLAGHLRCV